MSYYCYVCDKVEDTQRSWDEHFETCHLDSIMQNIYCSSCCLYIFGCNIEVHCSTTEHCDFLQIVNNLNSARLTESVGSDQVEVPTCDVENPQLMLNNTNETNGN